MLDDLSRLTRDPLRKLSKKESITGALLECDAYGIDAPGIITTLFYVLEYCMNEETKQSLISGLIDEFGIAGVLEQVCQIEKGSSIFENILQRYAAYKEAVLS